MALQLSFSSSSSFNYSWEYDVFLSFRGIDTRFGFTGNLYQALCDKGIHTFIDDEDLHGGDEITPSLLKAIESSRIAILVFSTNYASSCFCLDELVHIMECVKGRGRLVLPVFYCVDPSHVRHQRETYAEALARHENRFKDDKDKVKKWRDALHQAANLSGYHFKHGDEYEYKFIGKIVEVVTRKIRRVALPVADYPVGLEHQVSHVNSLLDVGSNGVVHMVGIHGTGGIGKTTLALAVYNSIADHFEDTCFLENVRENSDRYGLVHLQSVLLFELLGKKKIKLSSVQQGKTIIQQRLQRKRVLLIIDDVGKQEQLQAIVGKPDWFGAGSRVIITTRDKHLLACHGVERTYQVNELNNEDALELLIWKAFKSDIVSSSYVHVLSRAISYAGGLPLALEVIGSNLFGKTVKEWESALGRYEKIPNKKIQEILKVSFDALDKDEQSVFLDIACCFRGYTLTEVEDMLHAHYGDCMKYHVGVLFDKSLVKISYPDKVTLHDLIVEMGKEIVRLESPQVPGKRTRLWFHEDIVQVLEDKQGTNEIEIIHMDFPFSEEAAVVEWNGKAFKKMTNLKTLIIKNAQFSEPPKHLPSSLRVLEWWRCPSMYIPSNFKPKNLSICSLPNNCFLSLDLAVMLKKFVNLKVLNLDETQFLTEIPDVSGVPNLEKMSFAACHNLVTIHDSVGFLDKLKVLNAMACRKLKSFPPIKLPSLDTLYLTGCLNLEKFPEILGNMENITDLDLEHTGIRELPSSFHNLTGLKTLSLINSRDFGIPSSIAIKTELASCSKRWPSLKQDKCEEKMSRVACSNLERLYLTECSVSDAFLAKSLVSLANVKELYLGKNNFTILPACIKECHLLRKLYVDDCEHLGEIRGVPPNLKHFSAENCRSLTSSCSSMLLNQELHEAGDTVFTLPGIRIPEWFEHRSHGASISFWFRNKFPSIALCLAVRLMDKHSCPLWFRPIVIINRNKRFVESEHDYFGLTMKLHHIFLFDLQKVNYIDNMDEALVENGWNYAEVLCTSVGIPNNRFPVEERAKEIGIHVFKQKNSMEDVRFTDPYKRRKLDDDHVSPVAGKS